MPLLRTSEAPRHRAALTVASLCFLVGCSGTSADTGGADVASVTRSSATPASATVDVDDQRPLIRFDTTEAEKDRLFQGWTQCLTREGGSQYASPKAMMAKQGSTVDPKVKEVFAACQAKEPEDEDMREARKDPAAYKDHNRRWYQCAKAQGYALTTPDPDTGEFGLTRVVPNGDFGSPKIMACKVEAFGWK